MPKGLATYDGTDTTALHACSSYGVSTVRLNIAVCMFLPFRQCFDLAKIWTPDSDTAFGGYCPENAPAFATDASL